MPHDVPYSYIQCKNYVQNPLFTGVAFGDNFRRK